VDELVAVTSQMSTVTWSVCVQTSCYSFNFECWYTV